MPYMAMVWQREWTELSKNWPDQYVSLHNSYWSCTNCNIICEEQDITEALHSDKISYDNGKKPNIIANNGGFRF